jgi:hypothetical protein
VLSHVRMLSRPLTVLVQPVLLILVESAAINGLAIVTGIVAELCGAFTAVNLVLQMVRWVHAGLLLPLTMFMAQSPSLSGISFCLITLRVALAKYLRVYPGEDGRRATSGGSDLGSVVLPMHVHIVREGHVAVDPPCPKKHATHNGSPTSTVVNGAM